MSEKKSPPHKGSTSKPASGETKSNKRKIATPSSPTDDDEKKNVLQQATKRKRPNIPEGSPEHIGLGSPRGAGSMSRLSVPLSERQQMALLKRMEEPTGGGGQVSSTKQTPAAKKVNKRNERGEAPLHMAAKKGDYKQTKKLIKAGASVNMKDYAGWTALHEACNSGNLRVARQLLKAGAVVNVQGFDDDTPLHDASSNGHKKLVQLLLRHGANPFQANLKGKTAVMASASSDIEAILRGNSTNYSSDSDSNSDGSSSDSILSAKEDDRSIEDDFKLYGLSGKADVPGSTGSSSSISSSISHQDGQGTSLRRPSVPPSPDKVNPSPSPRLFLKLQHKKSSSSSSSTTDEQQRVAEWNVLTVDASCEVTSEGDINVSRPGNSVPLDRPSISTGSSSRSRTNEDIWPRKVQPAPGVRLPRGGNADTDGFPDSTVPLGGSNPILPVHHPLERSITEPFTPRSTECSEKDDEHLEVFSSNTNGHNSKNSNVSSNASCSSSVTSNDGKQHSVLPSALSLSSSTSSASTLPLLHQQSHMYQSYHNSNSHHQQHIPSQNVNFHHQVHKGHKPFPHTMLNIGHGSEKSVVSSSYASPSNTVSSSHVTNSGTTSCQISNVSSSSTSAVTMSTSTLPSAPVISSGLPAHHPLNSIPYHSHHHSNSIVLTNPSSNTPHNTSHTTSYNTSHSTSHPSQPPIHPNPDSSRSLATSLPFQPFVNRGGNKGGGSIVTGLSDRAVAASSGTNPSGNPISIVSSQQTSSTVNINPTTASQQVPRPDLSSSSRPVLPRVEELSSSNNKSDTSSCDSPLQVEPEDSVPSDQGSRPSTPKVPPLKIIMPTKAGSQLADDSKPQTKPALPYVVNPTWETGEEQRNISSTCVGANEMDSLESPFSNSPQPRPGPEVLTTDREGNVFDSNNVVNRNLDLDETCSRDSDARADQSDGVGEDGKEKRPTRTLRSHTAMLQQQGKPVETNKAPEQTNKSSEHPKTSEKIGNSDQKEECDNSSTTRSQKGEDSTGEDSSFPPRKRKLRNKTEQQTMQVSASTTTAIRMSQPLEKPPNPYETYLNMRRQIASRHRSMSNIAPKPPVGFKDFLMVNCTYVLQGNVTSTLSVPMLPPPNLVAEPMREFFIQQEKERYRLRLQHVIEREKLMLSIEQEILREHGRAARAMANQTLPFSVCTILREEEIYNQQELEQAEDRDKNVRSRYNGRQFISWLQDVDDKYAKIKQDLVLRHHHEAESLYAVQKLDWEWKLKESGLCDHKNTPTIDDLHVPLVTVSDEFDLLPTQ